MPCLLMPDPPRHRDDIDPDTIATVTEIQAQPYHIMEVAAAASWLVLAHQAHRQSIADSDAIPFAKSQTGTGPRSFASDPLANPQR